MTDALPDLPMTLGYFRLILRQFGAGDAAARAAILEGTGIAEAELADGRAEISLFQQVRQIQNVNQLAGEGWALRDPSVWSPAAHGALGVAVLSAPTLGDGLDAMVRYSRTRAPFMRASRSRAGGRIAVTYELNAALGDAAWRPVAEITLCSLKHMVQAVTGNGGAEMEFRFTTPEPGDVDVLRAALEGRLTFSAERLALLLPADWATQPSAYADAALHRGAVAELDGLLARLDSPLDFRARLERLVRTMPDGRIDAPAAAAALGVSSRTLARRLNEAGAEFRVVLDGELKRRAAILLAAGLSREAVAERLGYRDPTSLSRACRRWFG